MKNFSNKFIGFGVFFAATASQVTLASESVSGQYSILGGVDAGYAALGISGPDENDKDGIQVNFKALGSYELDHKYVFDLGGGWFYDRLSGQTARRLERNYLRAGFAEFSPQYRLTDRWQMGPYFDFGFGADMALNQGSNSQSTTAWYPGVQALYQIPDPVTPMRLGARAGTDISNPGRNLFLFQLSFQIGFPVGGHSTSEAPIAAFAQVSDPIIESQLDDELAILVSKNSISIALGKEVTNFATGSSKLSPRATAFLSELATYLARHSKQWGELDIQGHTDVRGTLPYNMKLSRSRAKSVGKVLTKNGVGSKKVKLAGYGPKIPIDPRNIESAWAKNRRVEIKFTGVKDPQAMSDEIRAIKNHMASAASSGFHATR